MSETIRRKQVSYPVRVPFSILQFARTASKNSPTLTSVFFSVIAGLYLARVSSQPTFWRDRWIFLALIAASDLVGVPSDIHIRRLPNWNAHAQLLFSLPSRVLTPL